MESQMKQSGFGIAALALGIIGLLSSCILIGIIPAVLGLIFAIVGLASKDRKHGTAIGGLVCSIIAILIFIFMIAVVGLSSYQNESDGQNAEIVDERNTSTQDNASISQSETKPPEPSESLVGEEETDDFSDVETIYELGAGFYTAGIDIPSGRCNVVAVSGTGNLSSSNMYSGGVNEMFGISDATDLYTESYNGLKLPEGTVLSTNHRLIIRLEYTSIEGRASGRTYDEDNAIELSDGNYLAGTDFPGGIYTIEAIEGTGNLSSSNIFDGGVNEMFGIDNGMGYYNDKVNNATLEDGVELTVRGGLKVKLIPAE